MQQRTILLDPSDAEADYMGRPIYPLVAQLERAVFLLSQRLLVQVQPRGLFSCNTTAYNEAMQC